MTRTCIFLIIAFILFTGCRRNTSGDVESGEIIHITGEPDSSFKENVSEYGFISLEATDNSLLSAINKIEVVDDRIFVLDGSGRNRKLFVFTRAGKFMNNISMQGRGPIEYVELENFAIARGARELMLVDVLGSKILIYDFDGNFKRSVMVESMPGNVAALPNGDFVLGYEMFRLRSNDFHALAICSPDGETTHRYIGNPISASEGLRTVTSLTGLPDGTVSAMPQLNDIIYHVTETTVIPKWEVRFPEGTANIHNVDASDFIDYLEHKNFLSGDHAENNRYLCIFGNKNLYNTELIFYDKESKKTKRVFNPFFGQTLSFDDELIVGVLNPVDIEFFEGSDDLKEELKAFMGNNENPPLIFYRLKQIG